MGFKHDPLRPHPRRKKKNETPDETERRLSADLRLLMSEPPRYAPERLAAVIGLGAYSFEKAVRAIYDAFVDGE